MKIFVTGGTGFIGSHFVKIVLAAGHEVIASRRARSAPPITLNPEPRWVETLLHQVPIGELEGCDAIAHFAAQGVSPQATNWSLAFETNVSQSLTFFSSCVDAEIPHLIACGSCFEYGQSGERYDFIPPNAPLEPIGPYAASKAAFSMSIESMARTVNSCFTILRPFHLYGEGQHSANLWPSLRIAAHSGNDFPMTLGEQVRDYMPVQDAALAFLNVIEAGPKEKFTLANIGSGKPISLRQFAESVWDAENATGKLLIGDMPYRQNEIMRYVPEV